MEVRSANNALLNRAAIAIENSGSGDGAKQQARKVNYAAAEENTEFDDQSVLLSISEAGLKKSLSDKQEVKDDGKCRIFSSEAEIEEMTKKMEGLSSQVINGNFSISDRLSFNSEIHKLSIELEKLNGSGVTVTMDHCTRLSRKISDLTRVISDAAVYRNCARTVFMVNSKQPAAAMHTQLDIAL